MLNYNANEKPSRTFEQRLVRINDDAESIDRRRDKTERNLKSQDDGNDQKPSTMLGDERHCSKIIDFQEQIEDEPVDRRENRRQTDVQGEQIVPIEIASKAKDRNTVDRGNEKNQTEQSDAKIGENHQKRYHEEVSVEWIACASALLFN